MYNNLLQYNFNNNRASAFFHFGCRVLGCQSVRLVQNLVDEMQKFQ